jgi:hypothetical protein
LIVRYSIGNVKCQLYVSHFDVKALALLNPQLHLNKNTKLNEFPKTSITQREKLGMIKLREEMQTEKPTMLNCSKDAHIIFEVFSFNIKLSVRHCEELIRDDWKKLMRNLPSEDIPLPQNHIR